MADWPSIVREHGPMAFETAWRILGHAGDAEDAVQEAFLAALRLYAAGPVDNWGGLMRRLASRRALDLLRRRRAAPPGRTPDDWPASSSSQPDVAAVAAEAAERLRDALAALPDREAEVFSLRYFGDLSNPQIAAALDITPGAAAVALHKARARLEAVLLPHAAPPRQTRGVAHEP